MRSTSFVVASLLILSSATGLALAGPAEDTARAHTKAATAALNLGNYEEAIAEYEAAY
jgi:hypothetical protein